MENMSTLIPMIISGIAAVAIVVSVITQVTKGIGFLDRIPTSLQVVVLSLILTPLAFIIYANVTETTITWYMIVGAVIAGFFVSFICMYGWEKLTEIIKKFKKND